MKGYGCYLVSGLLLVCGTASAFEQAQSSQTAKLPQQEKRTATEVWRSSMDTNDLLKVPHPISLGIEISIDNLGNQKISSYQQLNLKSEKRVSLSYEQHRPNIKFRTGEINTALKLRGDGLKMQFNPVDKTIPLQIEIKVTDDESSLRLDYRF
ncbi:hypothetical protein EHZ86_01915 [Aeromonas australiensis]|uniref:hypothetical protein n=1 Tax=Aeromonas australiensis TaxID=1114880 RepID=UPI001F2E6667|nr:hypothetical protein [Aeromonas australiensis]MCF3096101.1 hypothetical protein [Aeromonas australiensis]